MPLDSRDYTRGSHPPACTCADCVASRQGGAMMTCPMCEGRGSIIGGKSSGSIQCPTCHGTNVVTRESYRRVQEARRRDQNEPRRNQASVREALDNPESSHFEVLGVPSDASEAAIRDAFRRIALIYHPDRDRSAGATGRFQRINRAYQVLSNRTERSSYDSRLERERRNRRASQEAAQRDAARRTAQRVEEEIRRAAENAMARERTVGNRSRDEDLPQPTTEAMEGHLQKTARFLVGLIVLGFFGAFAYVIFWLATNEVNPETARTSAENTSPLTDAGRATAKPRMAITSPATDKAALVAFFSATGGQDWSDNTGWLSGGPIGNWMGVTTDDRGRVTRLDLSQNQLSGELPPELGNLTSLQFLSLYLNQLRGEIPPELGNLTNLQYLDLNGIQLRGEIPSGLGNLINLQYLYLSVNGLKGEIPPELGNLTHLQHLFLDYNQLDGKLPSELGKLTGLTILNLRGNELMGGIPPKLDNLSKLERLNLDGNQLSGCIPLSLQHQLDMDQSDLGGLPFC